jgi:tetratricopeptide (TPR) repeat protein
VLVTLNKDFFSGGAIGLAIGLLVALLAYEIGRAGRVFEPEGPVVAAPIGDGAAPAPEGGAPDASARIAEAHKAVEADPKNRAAWVALGNAYFDAEQPRASIDAYEHALQLGADDPDVITDQGVMYLAMGDYQKALANFQKAYRLDPNHKQSLFNMGVAYANMDDVARAEETWNKVIQTAPGTQTAAEARAAIERLRARRSR